MRARALQQVLSLPQPERLTALAEGLRLLTAHVDQLKLEAEEAETGGRQRSATLLWVQAGEEAAKALIILDLVRMGPKNNEPAQRQTKRFYSHLARGIYAELVGLRPTDLPELQQLADHYRSSLYLDGPSDVDWIFRNYILAAREDSLYVDYIVDDDGPKWVTPLDRDDWRLGGSASSACELVLSLRRLGATDEPGLRILGKVWQAAVPADYLTWHSATGLTTHVLAELVRSELLHPDATPTDARMATQYWSLPMFPLDLEELKVDEDSLRLRQRRAFEEAKPEGP